MRTVCVSRASKWEHDRAYMRAPECVLRGRILRDNKRTRNSSNFLFLSFANRSDFLKGDGPFVKIISAEECESTTVVTRHTVITLLKLFTGLFR